jgi:hypothetical protein
MKRDIDLIRKLLLHFEEKPNDKVEECPQIEGYSELEIGYHLLLMDEADLLRCERVMSSSSDRVIKVFPFSLTWQGHEFLEASRNDNIWKSALKLAGDKLGVIPFEILKVLLLKMIKEKLGV